MDSESAPSNENVFTSGKADRSISFNIHPDRWLKVAALQDGTQSVSGAFEKMQTVHGYPLAAGKGAKIRVKGRSDSALAVAIFGPKDTQNYPKTPIEKGITNVGGGQLTVTIPKTGQYLIGLRPVEVTKATYEASVACESQSCSAMPSDYSISDLNWLKKVAPLIANTDRGRLREAGFNPSDPPAGFPGGQLKEVNTAPGAEVLPAKVRQDAEANVEQINAQNSEKTASLTEDIYKIIRAKETLPSVVGYAIKIQHQRGEGDWRFYTDDGEPIIGVTWAIGPQGGSPVEISPTVSFMEVLSRDIGAKVHAELHNLEDSDYKENLSQLKAEEIPKPVKKAAEQKLAELKEARYNTESFDPWINYGVKVTEDSEVAGYIVVFRGMYNDTTVYDPAYYKPDGTFLAFRPEQPTE